ncbi:MAG: DUF5103 domain-containing protein [Marinifilaceae bacterium]
MLYNITPSLLLFLTFFSLFQNTKAQDIKGVNAIIKNHNIHTLKIYARNDVSILPIIELNSKQKVQVNFDSFQEDNQDLVYQIIHCDANWKKSNLSEQLYMEGFSENFITDYELSFNTNVNYANYSLEIPNDDIKLTKSGNYKIIAYQNEELNDTLFIAKFYIIESLIKIKGRVRNCTNPRYIEKSQEVDFSLEEPKLRIFNPINDLRTFVWQNGDQFNRKELKPLFIRDNSYSFDYNEENVFLAGNEYRQFNTNNYKLVGRYIKSILEDENYSYYNLKTAYNRHFKGYIYDRDNNGKFVINVDGRTNPDTEADYTYVNFTLAMDVPLNQDIYVYGEFTNWGLQNKYKMTYNLKLRAYTLSLLLKQGYYNYEYVVASEGKISRDFIEGSHYQTENDYSIAVYYKDPSKSYDRLIGFKTLNSTLHQSIERTK